MAGWFDRNTHVRTHRSGQTKCRTRGHVDLASNDEVLLHDRCLNCLLGVTVDLEAIALQQRAVAPTLGVIAGLSATALQTMSTATALGIKAGLSATAAFPAMSPASTAYATVGSSTYAIPYWCKYIDVILLSAGGGGTVTWVTLERGIDTPWSTSTITITVGDGSSAGGSFGGTGDAGARTVATVNGNTIEGIGGKAGPGTQAGQPVASGNTNSNKDLLLNGVTYFGGAVANVATPNPPGGGGRGGNSFSAGNKGARGQAWSRAYQ